MPIQALKKELKKRKCHILDCISVPGGIMIYYREYGSYPTDIETAIGTL